MTNKDIPNKVATRTPFSLPSSSGLINDDGDYVLYSYTTCIGIWSENACVYFNEEKYSVTTTKLQNSVRGVK